MSKAEEAARGYFDAIARGDRDAQRQWYAEDATVTIHGTLPDTDKAGVVAFFEELWGAFPDFRMEVLDVVPCRDAVAVRWRARGTFAGPGSFQGFQPNGAAIELDGMDLLRIKDGKVARNDAYTDGMGLARQLGALPPRGSAVETRMTAAMNVKTALGARLAGPPEPQEVAEGVWRVQGAPGRCTVYFIRDGDGVLMFDAGARVMTNQVRAAGARLGGITRIVLGHGHTDHRGTAPALGVPVYCHPDEVEDAEGSGGWRYWDVSKLPWLHRTAHSRIFHPYVWDGGPVEIAGTVEEGDDVAGFQVVHIPGHAPGLIALWRESDRLALVSDLFYTLDSWGRDDEAHVPMEAYNLDTEQARASMLKLAALEPAAAWPGHAEPVRGDVRGTLERAAAA